MKQQQKKTIGQSDVDLGLVQEIPRATYRKAALALASAADARGEIDALPEILEMIGYKR